MPTTPRRTGLLTRTLTAVTTARFRIASLAAGRWWFWVVVHPDAAALRLAAARYRPTETFRTTLGCVHPAGGDQPSGYTGLIRLARTHLTGEIVSHELLHAAVAVYRRAVHPNVRLGPGVGRNEERLAYIFGELYEAMRDRLLP